MGVQRYNSTTVVAMYIMGAVIRYGLLFSRYQKIVEHHIEVSTPLNSWKRVCEGLHLQARGINPYSGDLLHEAPITMLLYQTITSFNVPIELIFFVVDLATSVVLFMVAKCYMFRLNKQQEENKDTFAEDSSEFLLTAADYVKSPVFVAGAFLLNPYTIFNCVGLSTMVFHNFFMALFLWGLLQGWVLLAVPALIFCAMMSLYPVVLIIPLYLSCTRFFGSPLKGWGAVSIFAGSLLLVWGISTNLSKGGFVRNVYGFILMVPDLQPNIGLFWYFFTEMFDHFQDLFICSFQINATILYLIPLAIKFRKDPFLLTVAILFLTAVFKSYPCVGDVGFVLSLLPCFCHLFSYCHQGFLVGVIFLITSVLGPILWYLWIYSNSANANFYFGVTLAFAIALIFLLTDVLFAYLKREFSLKHGKERKIDGVDALLILE